MGENFRYLRIFYPTWVYTENILVFKKVTQLAVRALVAVTRKKLVKVKPQTLTYFDNLKKSNKKITFHETCYIDAP